MIVLLFALAMTAAPAGSAGAQIDRATQAYRQCLDRVTKTRLKRDAPPAEFDAGMAHACGARAEAMRRALVADDVASGVARAEAERNAATEVEHMTALFRTTYDLQRTHGPQRRPRA